MFGQPANVRDRLKEIGVMTADELLRTTLALESQSKKNEALLIAHISEIGRRKVHIDRGYPDLFRYVTQALGVSEGAAACRIQVAGVCQRFPSILYALASGEINLTVASRISPVLTKENCDFLLLKCRKISSRDVLTLLIDLKLKREPLVKPSLRKASAPSEKRAVDCDESGTEFIKPTDNCIKEAKRNETLRFQSYIRRHQSRAVPSRSAEIWCSRQNHCLCSRRVSLRPL